MIDGGALVGTITLGDLISLASHSHLEAIAIASDVMRPPIALRWDEPLRVAFETMLAEGVRELPVTDGAGAIVGYVDETSIAHAYARARQAAERAAS